MPPRSPSPTFLRLALGYVYFHFGLLKFFPDLSPAEVIATQTAMSVSFHILDAKAALLFLAVLETTIGLGFLFNVLPRVTFALFMFHMAGTFAPLFVLTEYTFKFVPFAPTIEGQYILKNLVFVAAGWTVLAPQLRPRRQAAASAADETIASEESIRAAAPFAEETDHESHHEHQEALA